eukprot:scaffold1411_cov252-Pinguiococcus_pyrenoidosus.AAC.9
MVESRREPITSTDAAGSKELPSESRNQFRFGALRELRNQKPPHARICMRSTQRGEFPLPQRKFISALVGAAGAYLPKPANDPNAGWAKGEWVRRLGNGSHLATGAPRSHGLTVAALLVADAVEGHGAHGSRAAGGVCAAASDFAGSARSSWLVVDARLPTRQLPVLRSSRPARLQRHHSAQCYAGKPRRR